MAASTAPTIRSRKPSKMRIRSMLMGPEYSRRVEAEDLRQGPCRGGGWLGFEQDPRPVLLR